MEKFKARENKTEQIIIRLTKKEKDFLMANCKKRKQTISEYFRERCIKA